MSTLPLLILPQVTLFLASSYSNAVVLCIKYNLEGGRYNGFLKKPLCINEIESILTFTRYKLRLGALLGFTSEKMLSNIVV